MLCLSPLAVVWIIMSIAYSCAVRRGRKKSAELELKPAMAGRDTKGCPIFKITIVLLLAFAGVGIGSVVRRGYGSNQRRPLPWVGLIKHALPYAPADGHMEGELSAEFNEDGLAEDLDEIPPFDKIRLKFEKRACLGDGPWAPAFTTPLTLADMPDILASLTWA